MASKEDVRRSVVVASKAASLDEVCGRILSEAKRVNYSDDDVFAIHLALEEAFINAVMHGNKSCPGKEIRVDYTVTAERIEISITDEGNGFDPQAVPDPRSKENLYKTRGRGLLLMRGFMNKVEFNEMGNCVRMVRYRGQPGLPVLENKRESNKSGC